MKSNGDNKSQNEEFGSNSDNDTCSRNSDLSNYENNRKIPKFNLEEYER